MTRVTPQSFAEVVSFVWVSVALAGLAERQVLARSVVKPWVMFFSLPFFM